jgi:hypothetical protein
MRPTTPRLCQQRLRPSRAETVWVKLKALAACFTQHLPMFRAIVRGLAWWRMAAQRAQAVVRGERARKAVRLRVRETGLARWGLEERVA